MIVCKEMTRAFLGRRRVRHEDQPLESIRRRISADEVVSTRICPRDQRLEAARNKQLEERANELGEEGSRGNDTRQQDTNN